MPKTINVPLVDPIEEKASVDFTKSTAINGSIGKHAVVTMTNGCLIVKGDIEEFATVDITGDAPEGSEYYLLVEGRIAPSAKINCVNSVVVKQNISKSAEVSVSNGNVRFDSLEENAKIGVTQGKIEGKSAKTGSQINCLAGNISVDEIDTGVYIALQAGNIMSQYIANGASINLSAGNIMAPCVENIADLHLIAGNLMVNGQMIQRGKDSNHTNSTVSIGKHKTYVNGVEVDEKESARILQSIDLSSILSRAFAGKVAKSDSSKDSKLNQYSPAMKNFINKCQEETSFGQRQLKMTLKQHELDSIPDACFDLQDNNQFMTIPTRLNSEIHDLRYFLSQPNYNGVRSMLNTGEEFFLRDLQPATEIATLAEKSIALIEQLREQEHSSTNENSPAERRALEL